MYIDNPVAMGSRSRVALKSCAAEVMHWCSVDRWVGAKRGQRSVPLVVGYHRVVEDFASSQRLSMPSMLVSTRTFTDHLEWIGRHYEFVSLDELADIHEGKRKQSRPVAVVTFDDGYRDFSLNAFPILKRMGIPSAVFVVTDLTSSGQLLAHDELYLLFSAMLAQTGIACTDITKAVIADMPLLFGVKKGLLERIRDVHDPFLLTRAVLENLGCTDLRELITRLATQVTIADSDREGFRLLDWDTLKSLVLQGVTVGSHSCSHVLLSHHPAHVVRRELSGSRRILEQKLGVPVRHAAYPDGRFNATAIDEAAAAGYRTVCTICGHRDASRPLMTLSRKMLWENSSMDSFGKFSPAILSCQINGIFDPADRCRLQHWSTGTVD